MIMVLAISCYADSEDLRCSWSEHIQLTSVCKTWRDTAMDCADVWSHLPFFHLASSSRFPEMLARSKETPVTLLMDPEDTELSRGLLPAAHLALLLSILSS